MTYPLEPPIEPMLAKLRDGMPEGIEWRYEPKWDGFRALVFKDGNDIFIQSRKLRPLNRYFPELEPQLIESLPKRCVIDGEIVIAGPKGLDFDALLLRIHPAKSRVDMLAAEIPAHFVAFDVLAEGNDILMQAPLDDRRKRLEKCVDQESKTLLTPHTSDVAEARRWFDQFEGAGLDGVVAKLFDQYYLPGERVMAKIKHLRTADCIVGGFRMAKTGDGVGSLLLGLYRDGTLHYVGHTSSFKAAERRDLLKEFEPMRDKESFGMGRTPGGPSRWANEAETAWVSVEPTLVCEVTFDHLQGERFRHAARFQRWRPDKAPKDCTFEQLEPPKPFSLDDVRGL